MMAKMFYTLDETKAALGKNEEEIKQLSREGKLREFRDGPRLMFKADQVEQIKAELGGGDAVTLGPSDTGGPMGLVDSSRGASGSGIALADSVGGKKKEETAFTDIGLSGTIGGVPSPGRISPGGTAAGTRAGVTVFDVDESKRADPSAQTSIGSGMQDQVNLESVGSGSGLLDLTRESDDTSLGAVFDELTPGAKKAGGSVAGSKAGSAVAMDSGGSGGFPAMVEPRGAKGGLAGPTVIEEADATAPAFGAMSLAAALVLAVGGFAVAAASLGYRPAFLDAMKANTSGSMYFLLAFVVVIVFAVIGFIVGKMGSSK